MKVRPRSKGHMKASLGRVVVGRRRSSSGVEESSGVAALGSSRDATGPKMAFGSARLRLLILPMLRVDTLRRWMAS